MSRTLRGPKKGRLPSLPALRAAVAALHLAWFVSLPAFAAPEDPSDPPSPISLKSFQTHGRIVIAIDDGVEAEWREKKGGFELLLKGIGLTDLGAPFGGEKNWIRQYEEISDRRVDSIRVSQTVEGVVIRGTWRFSKGPDAPADRSMEWFAYRDRDPSAYVVDFWPKKGPTVSQVAVVRKQQELARKAAERDQLEKLRADRRIAHAAKYREVEDLTKECRFPLSEDKDIFLRFRPVHAPVDFGRWFNLTTADRDYPYLEPKSEKRDAQYVRLALKLYKAGKSGLAIRVVDFFDKEYPRSPFRHEMKFLRANALVKLGQDERGGRLLGDIIVDAVDSPAALHSGMYLAGVSSHKGQHLAALEHFQWLIHHYPDHRLNWAFHLGVAEALYALRQTARAAKEYQWVIEKAPASADRSMAALRMGDLYAERFQHEQALAAYYSAIKHFDKSARDYPPIHINRAEALYWLGNYADAETAFKEVLDKYGTFPESWRASYRLGEILGRRGDAASQAASREWFYSTINHYPYTAGANLARLWLMPCGDHGGFDAKSAKRYLLQEAADFDGAPFGVHMPEYPDVLALSHVRTYVNLGIVDEAVDTAATWMRKGLGERTRQIVAMAFRKAFRKAVIAKLDSGRSYDAIVFHRRYREFLPTDDKDPVVYDFILRLSREASALKLGAVAQELYGEYEGRTGREADRALAATESAAMEELESMKRSEEEATAARAAWISKGVEAEPEIRARLDRVSGESSYSYEKQLILSLLAYRKGDKREALEQALKAALLGPGQPGVASPRMRYWLATLQAEAGSPEAAAQAYVDLRGTKAGARDSSTVEAVIGLPPVPDGQALVLAAGQLMETRGHWARAAQIYSLSAEDAGAPSPVLYGYARALRRTGRKSDEGKAGVALERIVASEKEGFWRKLAQEALATDGGGAGQ